MNKTFLQVLESNRQKTAVTLENGITCESFWHQFTRDMYFNQTLEADGIDTLVRNAMQTFESSDTLELINKKGRILKRFAKHYKDCNGVKLSDSALGIMGDRLQYYVQSETNNTYYMDFTNEFNWSDGMYGKSGSCYWGQYSASIPTLENGGGWCARFYDSMDDTRGIGRTWVMPKGGLLMCFNSYGIERAVVSKCIKSIFARDGIVLHYKKVEIYNSNDSCIPYINSGTGFILYPDGIEESSLDSRYDLDLEVEDDDSYICENCHNRISHDEGTFVNDYTYCDDCISELFTLCDKCQEYYDNDNVHPIHHRRYDNVCEHCAETMGASLCDNCCNYDEEYIVTDDEIIYCTSCDNCYCYCEHCEKYFSGSEPLCDCMEEEEEEDGEEEDGDSNEYDNIEHNLETVKILVFSNYGSVIQQRNIMVYRHSKIDGIFIYQNSSGEYCITHEESGRRVYSSSNLDNAISVLRNLDFINWKMTESEIQKDRELCDKISHVIR